MNILNKNYNFLNFENVFEFNFQIHFNLVLFRKGEKQNYWNIYEKIFLIYSVIIFIVVTIMSN